MKTPPIPKIWQPVYSELQRYVETHPEPGFVWPKNVVILLRQFARAEKEARLSTNTLTLLKALSVAALVMWTVRTSHSYHNKKPRRIE